MKGIQTDKNNLRKESKDKMTKMLSEAQKNLSAGKKREVRNKVFQIAQELRRKIDCYLNAIRKFEIEMYEMRKHIMKENNEARSGMDAIVTTHTREYFMQRLYSVPNGQGIVGTNITDFSFELDSEAKKGIWEYGMDALGEVASHAFYE